MMNEMKFYEGDREDIKEKILKEIEIINISLKQNEYLQSTYEMDINEYDIYIFSANTLFKLLGIYIEDMEIYNFQDINLYFTINIYLLTNDYESALNQLKILFEKENYYNNKSIFLYYFVKIIGLFTKTLNNSSNERLKTYMEANNLCYHHISNVRNLLIS